MMTGGSHILEFLIVFASLAAAALAGMATMRGMKIRTASDYFLGGRVAGGRVVGLSLFVTTSWTLWCVLMGTPHEAGSAALLGFGFLGVGGLLLLGMVFGPAYRESGRATVAGFLGWRFGKHVGTTVSIIFILFTLLVRIPLTILIGSRLLAGTLGWDPLATALLMIVVPGLFAVAGGYRVVLAVQSTQGLVAAAGIVVLAIAGASPGTSPVQGAFAGTGGSWLTLVAGSLVLAVWNLCIDQSAAQRMLAARTDREGKRGGGIAALLVGSTAVVYALVALQPAGAASTGLSSGWIVQGLTGATLLSLMMASMAGHFMSVSTLFTIDIFQGLSGGHDETALVLVGRLVTTGGVIFAILSASIVGLLDLPAVRWALQAVMVMAAPIAAVMIAGLVWRKAHGRGAIWALGGGWLLGALHMATRLSGGFDLSGSLLFTALSFLFTAMILAGVCILTEPAVRKEASAPILDKGLEMRKS